MTNRSMARQETARWFERRAKIEALVRHWHETHRDRWEPQHELVRVSIEAAVRELAREAVDRNPTQPKLTPFGKPRFEAMMHALVSQLRVKRFGPVHTVTPTQWRDQVDTISSELGWAWVDALAPALPLEQSDAKAA